MAIETKHKVTSLGNGLNAHSTQTKYIIDELVDAKAIKQHNKDVLTVTVNGITYDADTISMNYMSNVASVANFKYNQAVALGSTPAQAYDAVYKSSIQWKGATNTIHTVQIESIVEALELAMGSISNIIGV